MRGPNLHHRAGTLQTGFLDVDQRIGFCEHQRVDFCAFAKLEEDGVAHVRRFDVDLSVTLAFFCAQPFVRHEGGKHRACGNCRCSVGNAETGQHDAQR